jgi:hypothetical protein
MTLRHRAMMAMSKCAYPSFLILINGDGAVFSAT